ncbi:MAG: Chromate resistance protein ChrB [Chloroflexota bacterium]
MTVREAMDISPWIVLVYRVPSEPASKRVAIWRDLKRMGALYLQQCVCILPKLSSLTEDLDRVTGKIPVMDGEYTLFEVPKLRAEDEVKIIESFRQLRNKEYAEILEECETKFVKEVEFEHFRQNYTYEEAEEIEQDLEKIRRWFDGVKRRDWFKADRAGEVEAWLERCQEIFSGFQEEVYRRNGSDSAMDSTPDDAVGPLPRAVRPPSGRAAQVQKKAGKAST